MASTRSLWAAETSPQNGNQNPMQMPAAGGLTQLGAPPPGNADVTLRIAPVTVELDRAHILSTIGYNGSAPGPVLRLKEGKPVTVEVINDTDTPELVHWHGMLIPPEVDGTAEEGSPMIDPHGRRRFQLTPRPAGSRWYHSHAMAMDDLHKGAYTGQFGFVYVDGGNDPGHYDQELFLALRDWEPFFSGSMEDDDDDTHGGPLLEKPAVLNTDPGGLEVNSMTYSINDKALGSGEPIRVREGQRLLVHFLNASGIENRRIALAGHKMRVIAMDGNPVPTPQTLDSIFLGAGERIDAEIEMNHPGIWILGGTEKMVRESGLGVVVEYSGQHQQPQWIDPPKDAWDYTLFGNSTASGPAAASPAPHPAPQQTIEMIFEKIPGGAGKFNLFLVNGKPYPHEREFVLQQGLRCRLVMRNRTDDAHPMHMHRHLWELRSVNDKPTSGLIKDTVVVPYYGRAVVDFTADQPGLTLFHCHIQQHMDYGFKALFRYA
jgi:FtsP/CotA-like multicopper oxidase with cupredoxin domain